MCKPREFLPPESVRQLLKIVEPDDAIVVGGQAVAIWADRYRPRSPDLFAEGALTSKDLDFFKNESAVDRLVRTLKAQVRRATMDDHTPSAAVVNAVLDGRNITIDFMKELKGVDAKGMLKRRVILRQESGDEGGNSSIHVMHPMDCVLSRFANINKLHRVDDHAFTQGHASLLVLAQYIIEEISLSRIRFAQDILMELGSLVIKRHAGRHTHIGQKRRLHPEDVVYAFSGHEAFDPRWRELTLGRHIGRMKAALERFEQLKPLQNQARSLPGA